VATPERHRKPHASEQTNPNRMSVDNSRNVNGDELDLNDTLQHQYDLKRGPKHFKLVC
jgi:hypothetical protein